MTGAEIAELLSMPLSTVSKLLKSIGLGKRSRLEPPEPPNRYERSAPGELVHVDVKKLARFHRPGHRMLGRGPGRFEQGPAGYDYVHVCIDDYSRLAYVECSQTNAQRPRSRSWAGRSGGSPIAASRSRR
jgi:hypothetical protein